MIDPKLAYWSIKLTTGKEWSEHTLLPSNKAGQKGVRKLDWALDIISTGDIKRITELTLHCPDGRNAVLEIMRFTETGIIHFPPFQFKTKSMNAIGLSGMDLEYHVIGRVVNTDTGACECFAWDYRPKSGEPHFVIYQSSIYNFGAWRDTVIPMGALGIDVQGFRF